MKKEQLKKGDKVWYVDKYRKKQNATYKEESDLEKNWAVVLGRPFHDMGNDMQIMCLVPYSKLKSGWHDDGNPA